MCSNVPNAGPEKGCGMDCAGLTWGPAGPQALAGL